MGAVQLTIILNPALVVKTVVGGYGGTRTVILGLELGIDGFDVPYLLVARTFV